MAPPSGEVNFYDGYSFALTRTKRALDILERVEQRGEIARISLKAEMARTSNTMMGEEKRGRAFRIIETRRRQGKAVPDYGFVTPSPNGKQFVLTELNMLSHFFCFYPVGRRKILKFMLSSGGYLLLWLNNQRRNFRTWRRDSMHRLRRCFGYSGIQD